MSPEPEISPGSLGLEITVESPGPEITVIE